MDPATCLSPLRGRPAGQRPGRALPALPPRARAPGRAGRVGAGAEGRRSRGDAHRPTGARPATRASSRPWTEAVGPVPRVLLRDGSAGEERPALACSEAMPVSAGDAGRYQLHGEIARGGMGVVLKGRDVDLGRDVAVKVLLEKHRDSPEMVRRFVEEAQIAGQLQHPGIVPVYELGRQQLLQRQLSRILVKDDGSAGPIATIQTTAQFSRPDGMRASGPKSLLQVEGKGRLPEITIDGDRGEVRVIKEGLSNAAGVTQVGDRAFVLVGRRKAVAVSLSSSEAPGFVGTPAKKAMRGPRKCHDRFTWRHQLPSV